MWHTSSLLCELFLSQTRVKRAGGLVLFWGHPLCPVQTLVQWYFIDLLYLAAITIHKVNINGTNIGMLRYLTYKILYIFDSKVYLKPCWREHNAIKTGIEICEFFFFFFFFFGLSVAQITHDSTYAWLYYHHSQPFFFLFLFSFFFFFSLY